MFNSASAAIGGALPSVLPLALTDSLVASLAVSLVAGALAGVAGAIVSSPADAMLTRQASGSGGGADDESVGAFGDIFAGVGVRCLFFACSISVQASLHMALKPCARFFLVATEYLARVAHSPS